MKVSREQVGENRKRILEAASRLFREHGFNAVSVAEVMKTAGLTHGGFYGYFKSKDDLIAQTLAQLMNRGQVGDRDLTQYAAAYLAPEHKLNVGGGCAVASLGVETGRGGPEARAEMTAGLRRQIDTLSRTAPGTTPEDRRKAAIGSWSAMVGALMLARMSDDPTLADEVLAGAKDFIDRG